MSRFGSSKLGLKLVKVSGSSMKPTFSDGDVLLVRWFSQLPSELALGTVVLIERDEMPGVFLIKRVQKSHSGLYWVEGDNRECDVQEFMNDSRKWLTSESVHWSQRHESWSGAVSLGHCPSQ